MLTLPVTFASQAWALAAKHLMPCSIYSRTKPAVPDAATRQAFLDLRNTRTSDKLLSVFIGGSSQCLDSESLLLIMQYADEVGTSFPMVTEDLQRFCEAWKVNTGSLQLECKLGNAHQTPNFSF